MDRGVLSEHSITCQLTKPLSWNGPSLTLFRPHSLAHVKHLFFPTVTTGDAEECKGNRQHPKQQQLLSCFIPAYIERLPLQPIIDFVRIISTCFWKARIVSRFWHCYGKQVFVDFGSVKTCWWETRPAAGWLLDWYSGVALRVGWKMKLQLRTYPNKIYSDNTLDQAARFLFARRHDPR